MMHEVEVNDLSGLRRRCKGRMRILAQIHPPETTRAILECLNLPIRPPPIDDATSSSEPDHQFDLLDGDIGTGDFDQVEQDLIAIIDEVATAG